ncbi:hypothetical protein H6F67_20350 [Microcoleus sp. FACHB-1515]|uniref:hypothetical protein n=1 Tax=Cyanophyceae TaxID=3028117 RepID=UPI001682A182|nr:hypothetical protein [Microcoleus sp. FACHB-1515]MBD2092205.1 hypothetical protein [Microcoleus sp. FACHB-1515]
MTASTVVPPQSIGVDTESISAIDYLQHLHQFLVTQKQRTQRSARQKMPVYWRQLIEVGVPIDTAKLLAWAIVRYEVAKIIPTPQQQQLLRHYSRFICRAGLWRSNLLR